MTTEPTTDAGAVRADRFLAELADVKPDSSSRNATMSRVGALMLAGGVVLTIVGVVLSQTTNNPLDQSTDVSLGLCGIALAVAGLAVYLRYSFAQFLRFWLLRLVYEQGANAERSDPA